MENQPHIDPEEAKLLKEMRSFGEHLRAGGTLGSWVGADPADLEAGYALAGYFYERSDYETARRIYAMLLTSNPYERRFAIGLGMAHQMLKNYDDAVGYYATALAFDFDDPLPSFHMAECLLFKGLRSEALDALNICLRRATPTKDAHIYERAKDLHQLLSAAKPPTSPQESAT